MVCAKCSKSQRSGAGDVLQCSKCHREFHAACCRIKNAKEFKNMSQQDKLTWCCDECEEPKSTGASSNNEVLELLRRLEKEVQESRNENRKSFSSMTEKISFLSKTVEELKEKLANVESENAMLKTECAELRNENSDLKSKLENTEMDVRDMQQYSRNRNVEIKGVPKTPGEDVYSILESVAGAIDVPYNRADISIAHRLPGRYPGIVAQFVSRSTRAEWLAASKKKRVNTRDLRSSLPPAPVFINEHLTLHNKGLLGRAKSLVKEEVLAFAWTKEGKVLVKKAADSKAVHVKSFADIEKAAYPDYSKPTEQ